MINDVYKYAAHAGECQNSSSHLLLTLSILSVRLYCVPGLVIRVLEVAEGNQTFKAVASEQGKFRMDGSGNSSSHIYNIYITK